MGTQARGWLNRQPPRVLLLGGALLLAVLVALALVVSAQFGSPSSRITLAADPAQGLPNAGDVLGNPQAVVKVVEWGNYLCPHCGDFARKDQQRLIADYIQAGKVSLEFRAVAVGGQEATDAATASLCATDQGRFWVYHDTLYANQTGKGGQYSVARLKTMAADLGLDAAGFNSCLDGGNHAKDVAALLAESQQQGVDVLPTFFVDGQKVNYTGYDSVKAAIDAALAHH